MLGRARLRPSRQWHSARREARPPGITQGHLDERPSEEWEWSFEPDAAGRSAVNALAIGNAALLAYSDWDDIQHFLGKWQLSDARLLSAGETQGFVARRDDAVFISFRGTEPLRLVANKIASSIMTRFAGICPSWKRNWGENQPFKSLRLPGKSWIANDAWRRPSPRSEP
jgi:hypothetical protein